MEGLTASFLWLAAVTGALSLLTPCVFPMIPITVAYFNRNATRTGRDVARHALLFAGGIVMTFTALGLGLAVIVGAGTLARFAANPWVNIIIGLAFVAFALNLFGLYDLPTPFGNRFLNRVDSSARQQSGRALGSVLMGFAFTLASFTCTAPFVGPLLVSAARGDWRLPLVGMAVFSTVFATPFFLLALAPRWTAALPRSGPWLKEVKVLVGLVELAASAKFFSNADLVLGTGVISREMAVALWLALAVAAGVYLFVAARRRTAVGGWLRYAPVAITAAIAVWLAAGLRGATLGELEAFLPPSYLTGAGAMAGSASRGGTKAELNWIVNDHRLALTTAGATGQLVLVDFTGYTCTNCRWMESNMFARPEVAAAMSRFVLSRLYTDGEGEIYENQQRFQEERFGTVALPLYVILDANGRTLKTFTGLTRNPREFLAFLRTAS